MTAAPATATGPRVGGAWLGHVLPHAAMLAVMVVVMLPGVDATGHLAGALALLGIGLVMAPVARRRQDLGPVLVDLAGMGAVLVALATSAPGSGHHAAGSLSLLAAIAAGWLIGRLAVGGRRPAFVTGIACGAQLVAMIALALVRP